MTPILILLLISSSLAAPPKLSLVEPLNPTEPEKPEEISDDDSTTMKKNSGDNFLAKHQKFLSWLDFFDDVPQVKEEPTVAVVEEVVQADADTINNRQEQSAARGHKASISIHAISSVI